MSDVENLLDSVSWSKVFVAVYLIVLRRFNAERRTNGSHSNMTIVHSIENRFCKVCNRSLIWSRSNSESAMLATRSTLN